MPDTAAPPARLERLPVRRARHRPELGPGASPCFGGPRRDSASTWPSPATCASPPRARPSPRPSRAWGWCPDGGSTFTLPRLIGVGHALRFLMAGETLDAARALAIGLVDDVVPDDELDARGGPAGRRWRRPRPRAFAPIKRLVRAAGAGRAGAGPERARGGPDPGASRGRSSRDRLARLRSPAGPASADRSVTARPRDLRARPPRGGRWPW